jgi:hypothetical protein
MHTHGETIQLLEEQIKELQDRLRTSDEKLKGSSLFHVGSQVSLYTNSY